MSSLFPPRAELIDTLSQAGRELSTVTILFHSALAEKFDLNATDWKCADILIRLGPLTAGQLSELTGLTTGAITGVIDRLEQRGFARHFNGLGYSAQFQGQIDTGTLVDFQDDSRADKNLETRGLGPKFVVAGGNAREEEDSRFIGHGWPDGSAIDVARSHVGADNGGSCWVSDCARQAGADFLCGDRTYETNQKEGNDQPCHPGEWPC